MRKYGRVVNRHHVRYEDPEIVVKCFAGEHQILGLMARYSKRTVSEKFLWCLRRFIKENKHKAVKL